MTKGVQTGAGTGLRPNFRPVPALVQTIASNITYAARQAGAFLPLASTSESQFLLVSRKVIEKNYGIGRSISALSSMGYKIFIYEGDQPLSKAQRETFYRSYHLEHLLNKILIPVYGDAIELTQQITGTAHRKLNAKDLLAISFQAEHDREAEIFWGYNNLVLADDLLGLQPAKRADYPVLLLAAKLKEQPADEALKHLGLGAEYLKPESLGGHRSWLMLQTPSSPEFSDLLVSELQNYQAIAQRLAGSA